MTETWSERHLLEAAAAIGGVTTIRQLRRYVRWGLVHPTPDGTWDPDTARLLVTIKETGTIAREIHRRAVLLRRDYFNFPVPNNKLREAMIAITEHGLSDPRRKIRAVVRLWDAWSNANRDAPQRPGGSPTDPGTPVVPEAETWSSILANPRLSDDIFGVQAAFAYHLDRDLAGASQEWWIAMPLEERIVLIVILNLSVSL